MTNIFAGNKDPIEITRDDVENMKYTEMCIKETMRLYPIVAMISRQNDVTLKFHNCEIPPGASLVVNIHWAHRDPKYWGEDANVFKPSRFTKENFAKIHPYAYLAFSGGPRNCVGKFCEIDEKF